MFCRVIWRIWSLCPGNTKSPLSGVRLQIVSHEDLHAESSAHILGFIGIVRAFIFFFVTAFGITTSVDVMLSQRKERASLMRAAVTRHVDSAARTTGLTACAIASSCSGVSVAA